MTRRLRTVVVFLLAALMPGIAAAQLSNRAIVDAQIDAFIANAWPAHLAKAAAGKKATVRGFRLAGADAAVQESVYEAALIALSQDEDLLNLIRPAIPDYLKSLVEEKAESRSAVSTGNPGGSGLAEPSGATALAALVADFKGAVSADKTAVSINLNALTFTSIRDPKVYSDISVYQAHELIKRFSGTVTFGQKIPEKELTGLTGFPGVDTLLDATSWDVKVRVLGDRDVRAARWTSATVLAMGLIVQQAAVLQTLVATPSGAGDLTDALAAGKIFNKVVNNFVGLALSNTVKRIGRSAQLSVKTSGTHLNTENGKNKLSGSAMFDVGAGPSDFTANVQYSKVDDLSLGAEKLFALKSWTAAASLTSHLVPDAIVKDRTLDFSLGASGVFFQDKATIPIAVRNTWKVYSTFDFPVKGGAKIPLSIIYSNDANALTKQKCVSGQIGLSYDFSALKNLFLP